MRRKAAEREAAEQQDAAPSGDTAEPPARSRASQTWAMLIKRVYEIDPLCCPKCLGEMKVIAFLGPPQAGSRCRLCSLRTKRPESRRRPAERTKAGVT
jgi:hypothetical protein